jgi:hypothetical protein
VVLGYLIGVAVDQGKENERKFYQSQNHVVNYNEADSVRAGVAYNSTNSPVELEAK